MPVGSAAEHGDPDGVTRLFQCAEQLRLVVLQSLPPLGVTGTDGQNTSMQ